MPNTATFRHGDQSPFELMVYDQDGTKLVVKLNDRTFLDLMAAGDTFRREAWQRVRVAR